MTIPKKSVALCFLLAYVGLASAQVGTGITPYGQQWPINAYESVNLASLTVELNFPLRSKVGSVPFDLGLTENVQVYTVNVSGQNYFASTSQNYQFSQGYWAGQIVTIPNGTQTCGAQQTTKYIFDSIVDGSGATHKLPSSTLWDSLGCLYTPLDVFTTDNSGYELKTFSNSNQATVYNRDGANSTFTWTNQPGGVVPGTVHDVHANGLNVAVAGSTITYTDGMTATPILVGAVGAGPYTYTDGNGTSRNITTTNTTGLYKPDFNTGGCATYLVNPSSPFNSIHTVTYPDTSVVTATWKQTAAGDYDGRLASLTLPTGGVYTHTYTGGTNGSGIWCDANGVSNAGMTITDGSGTWTFTRTVSGTYPNRTITTVVGKPDGSNATYTFIGDATIVLTNVVMKDTDGTTVLDTYTHCYDSTIAACNTAFPTNHPAVIRSYHTVPGVANKAEMDTHYDTYGNVTEVDMFDFGPTLVGKTFTAYGSWNGSSCASMITTTHMSDRPCQVYSTDAGGTTIAQSYFNYNASGELLNRYDYTAAGVYLTSSHTYNANGTLASTTAVDGTLVTYGNTQCNNLLPDHATSSVGTASITWDCNLAMVKTTTDLNGLVTTTTYGDSMLRITQVSDNGGQAPVVYTYTSATQMRKNMTFNSGASITDSSTKVDSLGRILSAQRRRSVSGNYETVSYTYDTSGRVNGVSVPCLIATLGGTCPTLASSYTYDGMGRIKTNTILTGTNGVLTYTYSNGDVKMVMTPAPAGEVAKTVQIEYDGLGRLVSNCAVTSTLSGNGSCGQRTAANGYLTKYTLDALGRATQISRNAQAGQTPLNTTATYDFLSRVTQQVSPETGTSTFVYDILPTGCTNGGAVALAGHLNKSTDGAGNALCYYYLAESGRISLLSPISGPDLARTRVRNYTYGDVDGQVNGNGRIDTAGTQFIGQPNVDTFYGFTYDIYGRMTLMQQTSSGLNLQFTNITASYWDNDQIKTLGGIPGVSDYTFGLDAAGRPNTASSGATSIVSSVVYDSAGNPITINFANGDQDVYAWDGASQNMKTYTFKVGAGGLTDNGTYTWNPNLTLQKLVIADNVNGGDSQTCNYTHDDIARIATSNCGALWNETYAYSPNYAGNVTKSGSLSFSPGYTASNNRMLAPYTYNANGDMLHDATLNQDYLYDDYGDVVSYAGHVVSYDAFGNMLQKTVGATKTYYLYSPIGKLGSLSSLTAKLNLRIPLPGGGTITYDSAGNEQLNHPDLEGSTRLVTNRVARTYAAQFCYGPMGEIYCGTASASQYQGSFQDMSTGLDDFDATRYSGAQGRSITPTGGPNGYVKTNRPF